MHVDKKQAYDMNTIAAVAGTVVAATACRMAKIQ